MKTFTTLDHMLMKGLIPTWLKRIAIRLMLEQRLFQSWYRRDAAETKMQMIRSLAESPLALATDTANNQHYEVPVEFFKHVLGPHMKYSCCHWDDETQNLAAAERAMLAKTLERAELKNGDKVLDLGCGWGSLTRYIAEHYPDCEITALSNSQLQQDMIRQECERLGYDKVTCIKADINQWQPDSKYDVIISIEMFEHVRNYAKLLKTLSSALTKEGRLFIHHFCHERYVYPYDPEESSNWMAKHFFSHGLMPSEDLLLFFQHDVAVDNRWRVDGRHYAKTCQAWLENFYDNTQQIKEIFAHTLDDDEVELTWHYWQLFFLACQELFAKRGGRAWFVTHYLFRPQHGILV